MIAEALQEIVLPLPTAVSVALRSLNVVLAVWVAIFSLVSISRTDLHYQRIRFLGLALLCLVFTYGTLFRLGTPVTPVVPMFTAALAVCVWGTLGFLRRATP